MAVKKKSATVHRVGNPGYAKLRLKEKTVLKSLGQCSFTANSDPSAVDVGSVERVASSREELVIHHRRVRQSELGTR